MSNFGSYCGLPGTTQGLLRTGSSIFVLLEPQTRVRGVMLAPGLVAVKDGGSSDIYEVGHGELFDIYPGQVFLDLSESNGRMHALQWIGSFEYSGMNPEFTQFFRSGNGWTLSYPGKNSVYWTDTDLDLNPNDPECLPDGYRIVDMLALEKIFWETSERYLAKAGE